MTTELASDWTCKPTEAAWAAGFFDGEGCVTRRPNKRERLDCPRVIISQHGDEAAGLLRRWLDAIGVSAPVAGPYAPRSDLGRLPFYRVDFARLVVVKHTFEVLAPYLGPVKTEAFATKIAEFEAQKPMARPRRALCGAGLHDLTDPANVYVSARGGRQCRPCQIARAAARRAAA